MVHAGLDSDKYLSRPSCTPFHLTRASEYLRSSLWWLPCLQHQSHDLSFAWPTGNPQFGILREPCVMYEILGLLGHATAWPGNSQSDVLKVTYTVYELHGLPGRATAWRGISQLTSWKSLSQVRITWAYLTSFGPTQEYVRHSPTPLVIEFYHAS